MKKIQWLIVAGTMLWIAGCGPSAPSGMRGGTYSGGCAQPMSSAIADNIVVASPIARCIFIVVGR